MTFGRPSHFTLLTVLLCAYGSSFAIAATERPNIVIIMVDDMGYGDPGCFNPDSKIATPHIDSLAKAGMRFSDAHAPGPLCHMSRYGLLTGCYPFRTDVTRWPKQPLIDANQVTFASLAQQKGYRTAMVGKWHLGFEEKGYDQPLNGGPIDRGFDSFFGMRASTDIPPYFYIRDNQAVEPPTDRIEANRSSGWSPIQGEFWRAGGIAPNLSLDKVLPEFTSEAIQVINSHASDAADTPLLLYLAYPSPHTPWLPSEKFEGKSGAGMYGDFVMMVDDQIGKVLGALEETGLADDCMVVFSSDNGPVWRNEDRQRFNHDSAGGLRGMKGDAWEAGHRMPFIVRWPSVVRAGTISDRTICFTDVLATIAEVLHAKLPRDAAPDSYSFLSALKGLGPHDQPGRDPMVVTAGSRSGMMSIRLGDWKYINGLGSGGFSKPSREAPQPGGPKGQLYDLSVDPGEHHNLYQKYPKIIEQAETALRKVVANQPKVRPRKQSNSNSLKGKVMCGYQGWFNTAGDEMGLGWTHWSRHGKTIPGPGNITVDLWPDLAEYGPSERFATEFRHANGRRAEVFSSANKDTVARHFRWMEEYGIDGVFLQRFANGLKSKPLLEHKDRVLAHVRSASKRTGRVYSVMYDLSGLKAGQVERVFEDWKQLQNEQKITEDSSYLKHNGKPLVAVWGIGFNDGGKPRDYTLEETHQLIKNLKRIGCSVMLGIPSFWRELRRDAFPDPKLFDALQDADILSPWTIGRYRNPAEAVRHAEENWKPDIQWCKSRNLTYMPVVFPGFSWHNLYGAELDAIPRLKGQFLWSQMVAAKQAGAEMIYVAMFDEVDEATAIFKCTNQPPVGEGVKFLTYEGLPSDHYMWLTGQGGRMLRGEIATSKQMPPRGVSKRDQALQSP